MSDQALARWRTGDVQGAVELLERMCEGTASGEAGSGGTLAWLELQRGGVARSVALLATPAPTAPQRDSLTDAILALAHRAEVWAFVGHRERAMTELRGILDQPDATGPGVGVAIRALGQMAHSSGDTEEALRRYDEAIGAMREVDGYPEVIAIAYLDSAEALLDRDGPVDPSAAAARLADARDVIESAPLDALRPRLDTLLLRARGAAGDPEGAVRELEELTPGIPAGPTRLRWRYHAALARLYEQQGASFLARKAWENAVETLESIATALPRELRDGFWNDTQRRLARQRAASRGVPRPSSQPHVEGPLDGRLTRLLEILKRLVSETDVDRLLERVTDCAVELTGAERGFVLLTDSRGTELLPRTVRDLASPDDPHVAFSRSIAEAVLIDGEPIVTVDARADRRLQEYVSVHRLMLKSVACLPIRGRAGTVGVLYLEHRMRRGRFGEADLDLLHAFADQAAIALENARLLARLDARRVELERANEALAVANEEIERLLHAKTAELEEARGELVRARKALRTANDHHGIIGRSERMRRVFAVVDRVQDTDIPVVVQGESGTGKELIARAIHFGGRRAEAPFVALNCAAIPENLLESELFGHVRGAFTGADRDRKGVIARASGGTLFLDEVGDMPPKMQVDLLRVLQQKTVRPIGSDEELSVDIRVIAASNKSLAELVERSKFREDLYYRLNVVELWLPPLRERRDDIPLLCEHFLAAFAKRDACAPKRISRGAVLRLSDHQLPGNVRQLEHLLLNAWVMCTGEVIEADDLAIGDDGSRLNVPPSLDRALSDSGSDVDHAPSAAKPSPPPASVEEFKESEKRRILDALEQCNWNRVRAAGVLGMARRTFYRRLKEYDIL